MRSNASWEAAQTCLRGLGSGPTHRKSAAMAVHRAWVPRAAAKAGAASGGAQRPRARPALAPPPASRGAPKSGVASAKKEAQSGAVLASEPRAAPQEAAQEAPAAGGELTLVRPLGGSRFKLRVEPHTRTLGDFLLNLLRQRVKKARKLQKSAVRGERVGDAAGPFLAAVALAAHRAAPTCRSSQLRALLCVKHRPTAAAGPWEQAAWAEPLSPGRRLTTPTPPFHATGRARDPGRGD